MINLQPWRRQRRRREIYKACGFLLITAMILAGFISYYLYGLMLRRQQLHSQLAQQNTHQERAFPLSTATIVSLNKLIWQQQHYWRQLVNLLSTIPPDIMLNSLECQGAVCECEVAARYLQQLTQVFPHDELRDLKQGGCPLCYRAKIDVKL